MYFKVELDGRRRFFGQNCFPVVSLNPGIKFVPMRTGGGELIPESGLFVRIKKTTSSPDRTTSPISGGVELSQQLLSHNPATSLPIGASYFRSKFASSHNEDYIEEDDEENEELVSGNFPSPKRRVTSPAVLQKQRKNGSIQHSGSRDGAVSVTRTSNEAALSPENGSGGSSPSGTVHVEVDVHENST